MAKKQSSKTLKEPKEKKEFKPKTEKAETEKVGIKPLDPPPPGCIKGMAPGGKGKTKNQ